ncbi:MAG: DUF1501 domain-containing protein [Prosthecobacter sp.]|jgi:hypothetical protein|uniref:DUF1501 domain-containing protein n=1 Tax=Prosthecobacter sp. TaxID=1965333 RepID=UPI0019E6A623|nr:DUF1501 domain-containing protein [Prosthecobacter sp.]MBE2284267.1 DUF1501 domain-containing protein [Prosthecobacter sp.]
MTMACARCHDHKYDPVSQRDYYALAGIFRSTDTKFGTIKLVQNNNVSTLMPLPATAGQPDALKPLSPRQRERLTRQVEQGTARLADVPNHPPAFLQMHCGIPTAPRPSMGAWITYGLGSMNEILPGFVTLSPNPGNGGSANYGSSFLPAIYQGTRIGNGRQPIAQAKISNLAHPQLARPEQRAQLDFVQQLNRVAQQRQPENAAIEGLIESHELAFRMQDALSSVLDIESESDTVKKLYGIGNTTTDDFGRQCLMARRMLEAGVRFVEVNHGGWDQHRNLTEDHGKHAAAVDGPIAGLLTDLEGRGLLKDTLVIFAGEFGRTPYAQIDDGRDHNHTGYTTWFAGAGVKPGFSFGETDEFGYESVIDPVHIHDWHATILHLLGLEHTKLTYRYAGRDMRLTEVKGNVVKGIMT